MVIPFSSSISDPHLSTPPINTIPSGDAQALWCRLLWAKLCDSSQEPVLERVWHVEPQSQPPHAVTPVCVWPSLCLLEGRSGREQILEPLVWSSSTSSPLPLPPDMRITEMLVISCIIRRQGGKGTQTKIIHVYYIVI